MPSHHRPAPPVPALRGTDVVNAFLATLGDEQKASVLLEFTEANATAWSNRPCGGSRRPGIQLGTLTETQLAAAKAVLRAAQGTGTGTGFHQAMQILAANQGGGSWSSCFW
jgi:hypothetical protein